MKTTTPRRSFLLLAASSLLAVSSAPAATATWDGDTSANWSDAGNWDAAPALTGDSLIFSGTLNQTNTNNGGTPVTSIGSLTLSNGGWNIGLGSLDMSGSITVTGSSNLTGTVNMTGQSAHTITLNGTGTTLTMGTLILGRLNNTTTLTVNGTGNTLEIGGLQLGNGGAGNNDRTINNSANVTITGAVTQSGNVSNFTKNGTGTLTLKGANSYTSNTIINAGTLDLGGGSATGSLASTAFTLGSATFNYTRTGNTTQSFTTTNLTGGAVINVVAGNTLNLGTLTRGTGAVVFGTSGTISTSTANDANNIIGGWATIGGDWAVSNGAGNAITAYGAGTYDTTSVLGDAPASYAGKMISVDNNQILTGLIAPSTLNFRSAAANTLTLATGNNDVDGIMVTTTVDNNASAISGGTLRASIAGGTLNIIQNNTSNTLTINSVIANNTSASGLLKSGAGTLVLTQDATYTGTTVINGGTLQLGAGGATGKISGTSIISGTGSVALSGPSVSLNNSNTFSGGFTFNSGSVGTVASGTFNGFGTGLLTVAGSGLITFSGSSTVTINNNLKLNAGSNLTVTRSAGNPPVLTWTGDVELGGNATYTSGNSTTTADNTFSGDISDGGGGYSLSLAGSSPGSGQSVVTFSGNNTYSGGLNWTAGKVDLNLNSATALGTGTFTIGNSRVLDNTSGSEITLTTNNLQSWNSNFTFTGTNDLNLGTGAVTINNNRTVTVSAGTLTVDGGIGQSSGTRTLTKAGNGTMALGGSSTYSGITTVTAGTLLVNNTTGSGTGSAAVTVAASGTLGGTGIISGTVSVSGVLAPGASIESLATGALSLAANSTYAYEMNKDAAADSAGDLTSVTGNLTLDLGNATILTLADLGSGSWTPGEKLTLISYSGTWNGGLFNYGGTLADDSTFAFSGSDWLFNYNDTVAGTNFTGDLAGSSFVTMTVVPEPSTALLGALGLLTLLRRRR